MYKIGIWGFGAMGSGIAKNILSKKNLKLVGVHDLREEYIEKDVGELLGLGKIGIKVYADPITMVKQTDPDLVVIATNSFISVVKDQIISILKENKNVITIAEEMAFPFSKDPKAANEIDEVAKNHNVSVLGTGVNPGFVLDTLIITLTGICLNVQRIKAARINDLSPFGPTVMETQGVGTTPEEFEEGIKSGKIVGHIGFEQSIHMIAKALGWEIDRIEQKREPIISNVLRETKYVKVQPGMVAGCNHTAKAFYKNELLIELEHPQQVHPELENVQTGDYITIHGDPEISMSINPEIPGGKGTIAIATNMIPSVVEAQPGLLTMVDLPIPRALLAEVR